MLLVLCVLWACAGRGLSDQAKRTEAAENTGNRYVRVVREYANLRLSDSSRSAILRRPPRGRRLLVLTRNGKWYQVLEEESGALGWVHEIYVDGAE